MRDTNTGTESRKTDDDTLDYDAAAQQFFAEEICVLQECLYLMQGIDSDRLFFCTSDAKNKSGLHVYQDAVQVKSFAVKSLYTTLSPNQLHKSRLGSGSESAIRICGELGWLYRRIQNYIDTHSARDAVTRAFGYALAQEQHHYVQTLAMWEHDGSITSLRVLLALTPGPLRRLAILAMLADGLASFDGTKAITALHMHTYHGDEQHVQLVKSLLSAASRPWWNYLMQWTTTGVLPDANLSYSDNASVDSSTNNTSSSGNSIFFVTAATDNKNVWRDTYTIDWDKVPEGIIDRNIIEPAFKTGKGINYIRHCLRDGQWKLELEVNNNSISSKNETDSDDGSASNANNEMSDNTGLAIDHDDNNTPSDYFARIMRQAATQVNSYIIETLHTKHNLIHHLHALKQFLLLGQGDFFSSFVEGVHSEYGNFVGLTGVYRHSLAAIMDTALRGSNATSFSQDILGRLQVELNVKSNDAVLYAFGPNTDQTAKKDGTSGDTRTVWDAIVFDYILPEPVTAVVHDESMQNYRSMFRFLFTMRKVEYMLNTTWRQSAALQHALHSAAQYNAINVASSLAYSQATILLRQIAMTRQSMMHFVVNLKSYVMFDVIEGGWLGLVQKLGSADTLDDVIVAHDMYLQSIVRKTLLIKQQQSATLFFSYGTSRMAMDVNELLELADKFCQYQKTMFDDALQAAERAASKRRDAEERVKHGEWGFESQAETKEEETFFGLSDANKIDETKELTAAFNKMMRKLLTDMDDELHNVVTTTDTASDNAVNNNSSGVDRSNSSAYTGVTAETISKNDSNSLYEDDMDSLRFLAYQLDNNQYFGITPTH